MYYGVTLEDYGEKWRQAMKEWSGGYSKRTADDAEERKFWHNFMKTRGKYHQDTYARLVASEMCSIIRSVHPGTILEIGPGWGNYTFELADLCQKMYCTDISNDVLTYLEKIGKAKSVSLHTIESKWEDYNGESMDVIVAFNCFYRMVEIEHCLKKINQLSKKLCVIGMTSGPEQPYFKAFERQFGVQINYHRLDYIYLINLLYQLGIDCNVKIIPLSKRYTFSSLEQAAERESRRILSGTYDKKQLEDVLETYLQRTPEGEYFYDHKFCGALLYWKPQKVTD